MDPKDVRAVLLVDGWHPCAEKAKGASSFDVSGFPFKLRNLAIGTMPWFSFVDETDGRTIYGPMSSIMGLRKDA